MNARSMQVSVAIIGLGPRGIGIFERLLSTAKLEKYTHLDLTLFLMDPGIPGVGVHHLDQRDYMLLNTPVELPTLFPGDIFGDPQLAREGMSFQEWVLNVWQEEENTRYKKKDIQPGMYLPRRLMGQYLNWVFHILMQNVPPNVTVKLLPVEAKQLIKQAATYSILTSEGNQIEVDSIFLTIGQADRAEMKEEERLIIKNPYPMHEKLKIAPGEKVALNGMGLVAFDAISEFTIGKGGRFVRTAYGELEYQRSGLEPTIYLFSKGGIPYRGRPVGSLGVYYDPLRLTRDVVKKIRQQKGSILNFEIDIMPLLLEDMIISYYITWIRKEKGENQALHELMRVKAMAEAGSLHEWQNEMQMQWGSFNPLELIYHDLSEALTSSSNYREWYKTYLKNDIEEARKGLPNSPIKSALEVLLQVREGIREAVDFGGLTEDSWTQFFSKIAPLINKDAIGPELERVEELLALIHANVVDLSLGPYPVFLGERKKKIAFRSRHWEQDVEVDLFCEAHLKVFEIEKWHSSFVSSLLREGIIQGNCVKKAGLPGVQIDSSYRVIGRTGEEAARVWILGPMCEGSTYYNYYVPITKQTMASPPFLEAQLAVDSFFDVTLESCGRHVDIFSYQL